MTNTATTANTAIAPNGTVITHLSRDGLTTDANTLKRYWGSGPVDYGLPLPDHVRCGISARLIWNSRGKFLGPLEYFSNRAVPSKMSRVTAPKDFENFFNYVLESFRTIAYDRDIFWDSDDLILIERGKNKSLLTTNSSCGYVYCSVWEE